jgi:hypothetical protein
LVTIEGLVTMEGLAAAAAAAAVVAAAISRVMSSSLAIDCSPAALGATKEALRLSLGENPAAGGLLPPPPPPPSAAAASKSRVRLNMLDEGGGRLNCSINLQLAGPWAGAAPLAPVAGADAAGFSGELCAGDPFFVAPLKGLGGPDNGLGDVTAAGFGGDGRCDRGEATGFSDEATGFSGEATGFSAAAAAAADFGAADFGAADVGALAAAFRCTTASTSCPPS